MLPLHIIGHAGCGKTTLIVELVTAFVKQNITIGTMKHSAHVHELDKPGKDSFRHRVAGASPVSMVTEHMSAIYLPRDEKTTPEMILQTYYKNVEIVLIEGWISGPFPKIEVWREAIGKPPLFSTVNQVKAIVCEKPLHESPLPVFSRSKVDSLVKFILSLL